MMMKNLFRLATAVLALSFALALPAHAAASAKLEVTKPLAAGNVKLTFTANGVTQVVSAAITANDSADTKCKKIKDALTAKGYTVTDTCPTFTISNLPNGTTVKWDPDKTGEGKDQLTMVTDDAGTPPDTAAIGFVGKFEGVGGDGDPASFSAGVVTEGGGGVTVIYTVPPGVPVVDGGEVAAMLYPMLLQAIEDTGLDAYVALDFDTLLVEFGAGAGSERGIEFGTTATNNGVVGTIN